MLKRRRQPTTDTMGPLKIVWCEILETDAISDDATFLALGGDSLALLELQEAIAGRFGVHLRARDLLAEPTLRGMASRISESPGFREESCG